MSSSRVEYPMGRDEIIHNLLRFDEEARIVLEKYSVKPKVVIMGGSAFILTEHLDRVTHDIDVLSLPRELYYVLGIHNMNQQVSAYVDNLPQNYENRLVSLELGETLLDYFTPALEDLVVTKLYSLRPQDSEDISSENVLRDINWELLEHLVYDEDEAQASKIVEHRYKEMVKNFEAYKKEHRNESVDL